MKKNIKLIAALVTGVTLALAAPMAASATFDPLIVDNAAMPGNMTFNGTYTNVETTVGGQGSFNAMGTSPIYFATDASASLDQAWVQWTFSKPVTRVRVYYAYVESLLYGGGGANDPQSWTTSAGDVNLASVAAGGNTEASAGDVVAGQPEAHLAGNVADCQAPNVTCSGYVDLIFPEGISWIKTQNAPNGGGPGFNGVGLALDASERGPVAVTSPVPALAQTGIDSMPLLFGFGALGLGLTILALRRLSRFFARR